MVRGRDSGRHFEQLEPLALQRDGRIEYRDMDRHAVLECAVRSEEVVVGNEQGGQRYGTALVLEAGPGSGVELVGAVETLDELFEWAELLRFVVFVLQPDDGAAFDQFTG